MIGLLATTKSYRLEIGSSIISKPQRSIYIISPVRFCCINKPKSCSISAGWNDEKFRKGEAKHAAELQKWWSAIKTLKMYKSRAGDIIKRQQKIELNEERERAHQRFDSTQHKPPLGRVHLGIECLHPHESCCRREGRWMKAKKQPLFPRSLTHVPRRRRTWTCPPGEDWSGEKKTSFPPSAARSTRSLRRLLTEVCR